MTWRFHILSTISLVLAGFASCAWAQPSCQVVEQKSFANSKVHLVRGSNVSADAKIGIFKAPLAINTDGAPNSYHPNDFLGQSLAINRLDNGITIRAVSGPTPSTQKKIEVFNKWRDSDWSIPSGYQISWKNVIAEDAKGRPCVFKTGPHAGYFGSLTALKNDLPKTARGECDVDNQIDQRVVAAIVLRGGNANPLKGWGAKVGDLVFALNPATGATVPAVIGDSGDGNRIGEGSVALNMALLGKTEQPKTYADAVALDTGTQPMIVAVVPGSRSYKPERPFSPQNISQRLSGWATQNYGSLENLKTVMQQCSLAL